MKDFFTYVSDRIRVYVYFGPTVKETIDLLVLVLGKLPDFRNNECMFPYTHVALSVSYASFITDLFVSLARCTNHC